MNELSFLSLVTAPVEVLAASGKKLSQATCFFYKRDEEWSYLITNWHVVTGRDPTRPQFTKSGAVPTTLRLTLHGNVDGKVISTSKKVRCDVTINDDTGNNPEWLEHPTHKSKVDLVVVKMRYDDDFKQKVFCHYLIENTDFQVDLTPSVMGDVFVIGYPWALTGGDPVLPLYKRGIVASEPVIDHGGLPRFLIDCRTSEAMSGSPVLCSISGLYFPPEGSTLVGPVHNFAGVYSGRLKSTDDANEISEIGIVWKRSALDEIIKNGVPGTKLSDILSL